MRRYFEASSRAPALFAALAVAVILVVVVFPALPIGGDPFDASGGYTQAEALAVLDGYGEAGRRTHIWASLTLDTALPVVYAGFLGGLIYRYRPSERWWKLAYLPLAAGAIDLGENVWVVLLLTRYPDISSGQVAAASLFMLSKWYTIVACLTLATTLTLVAGVRRARDRLRDRTSAGES